MPQLAVNMKINTQNKHYCNTQHNRFKMRHAACSNRNITIIITSKPINAETDETFMISKLNTLNHDYAEPRRGDIL